MSAECYHISCANSSNSFHYSFGLSLSFGLSFTHSFRPTCKGSCAIINPSITRGRISDLSFCCRVTIKAAFIFGDFH